MIYNLFLKDTGNIGDTVCAPLLYFNLGECKLIDVTKWREYKDEMKDSSVILGGGGLFHLPSADYANGRFTPIEEMLAELNNIILWGIGHNIHGVKTIEYPEYMDKFKMIGVRDCIPGMNWVPCASCMSELFDKQYEKVYKAVAYVHRNYHGSFEHPTPTMWPEGASFETAIEFLGSAETILTNSYHGMYWGMLLNRNVQIVDAYSSKFYGLVQTKNFLDLCRGRNVGYSTEVSKLIRRIE
jgi:hypothetical protein